MIKREEGIKMSKLRKIVHLVVCDFDMYPGIYSLKPNKNRFGYIFQNNYYFGGKLIYQSPYYGNLLVQSFIEKLFRKNCNQLTSLRKRVEKLSDSFTEVIDQPNGEVDVRFSDGSILEYHGRYKEDFYQKVLKL